MNVGPSERLEVLGWLDCCSLASVMSACAFFKSFVSADRKKLPQRVVTSVLVEKSAQPDSRGPVYKSTLHAGCCLLRESR